MPSGGGKNCGQRGTVHSRDSAQHHFGRGHGGAGVAGGDEAGGAAFAHQSQSHADGGVALGAHRLHRLVVHGDDFAGVQNFNGQARGKRHSAPVRPDHIVGTHQNDANAVVPGRLNRAFDFRTRRPVRAHRVQGYDACHGDSELAGFLDVENFAAFVIAALGAGAMRELALVTVGTLGKRMRTSKRHARAGCWCGVASAAVLDLA